MFSVKIFASFFALSILCTSTIYFKGYSDGLNSIVGYNIRNPTFDEAVSFIAADTTDTKIFSDTDFMCNDFASEIKKNAFKSGYLCFWVYVEVTYYTIPAGHAVVAFNTTDRGMIYIEPQTDRIVNLQVGQPYWDRRYYSPPPYDDTVKKVQLMP